MPTVADVLRRYGEEYLERFGATMPTEHKKVFRAITACRTGALGTVLYAPNRSRYSSPYRRSTSATVGIGQGPIKVSIRATACSWLAVVRWR